MKKQRLEKNLRCLPALKYPAAFAQHFIDKSLNEKDLFFCQSILFSIGSDLFCLVSHNS